VLRKSRVRLWIRLGKSPIGEFGRNRRGQPTRPTLLSPGKVNDATTSSTSSLTWPNTVIHTADVWRSNELAQML